MLWASGGTLALVWTALNHPEGAALVAAMGLVALIWGLLMAAGLFDRLGVWYLHAAIALAQVVITVAYAAVPDAGNDMRLFYVWATPYAALFFRRRSAVLHAAWALALLAATLWLRHQSLAADLAVLLTTTGLVISTLTLVSWAAALDARSRQRLRHLAEHDPLTGLPRVGTARRIGVALQRAGGHPLLLDDFGTGYSFLAYLAALPVDVVKVDRSFVAAMFDDHRAAGVLEAVLRLGQAVGMVTVAEGVETAEQADRLLELGCDRAQGWFFGRPAPAAPTELVLRMATPV